MDFKKGDLVIISDPLNVNKDLKGKTVKIYDPRALNGEAVAASFTSKKDIKRFSGKLFYFRKSEIAKL